jgi:glycerol-3-phosphate dehydrogenase
MSTYTTACRTDTEVVVIGAGVVGCAVALALARRGVEVTVLEAEAEPGLGASATNSGILHTGFDSTPGELETDLIMSSARLRDPVLTTLGIPVSRCGAVMRPQGDLERGAVGELALGAARNGVVVVQRRDGALEIPGEAVTDPVQFTLALAAAGAAQGAELRVRSAVAALESGTEALSVHTGTGDALRCRVVVNCAGLEADSVARMAGDDSFSILPRKGEFLVFEPPGGTPLEQILLPVPTKRTKGVLVFPTVDGKVVSGPTAVDLEDKRDWSVRPEAAAEILPKACAMYPPLEGCQPIAAYAGLRPAGRDCNYVVGVSRACARLVNVAAIRSTGLSASLGIAQRVAEIVASRGVKLGLDRELARGEPPPASEPWWRRAAVYRGVSA